MNLKRFDGRWILHIIDLFSRFTMSVFISRKNPTDVIHGFMSEWCSIFGIPKGVLTDNGGEFINSELLHVESMLNIQVFSTAAESPFQNGICERNHQVVDSILRKLVQDYPKTPIEILLKWACMAKNTLQMYEGFSSYQLVLGRNPNIPNILSSSPSQLEQSSISQKFVERINGLQAARKAFVESESSIKLKKALKAKIRVNEEVFHPGDKVYYKRDNVDKWLGPAKVIFQDGKVIFIRHGAVWVRVSPNRLVKSGREFSDVPQGITDELSSEDIQVLQDSSDDDNPVIKAPPTAEEVATDEVLDDQAQAHEDVSEDFSHLQQESRRSLRLLNREKGWDVFHCSNTFNFPCYEHKVFSNTVPKSDQNSPECIQAKVDELEKLNTFAVYSEVEDHGQKCIDTRWVITYKDKGIKARLVARGFQEQEPRAPVRDL